MDYKIKTEPEAHEDIQEGIDWYNKQQSGLGRIFHSEVKAYIKKYPYMIHYTINEEDKIITIKAVFNTNKDPQNWKMR